MKYFLKTFSAVLIICMLLCSIAYAADFEVTVTYNDQTYGYGTIPLTITGTIDGDEVTEITSVYYGSDDVISYMTDEIEGELKALILETAGEDGMEASDFEVTVTYNDQTYGYGTIPLTITGTIKGDEVTEIKSVYYGSSSVTEYLTEEIAEELRPLILDAAASGISADKGGESEGAQDGHGGHSASGKPDDMPGGFGGADTMNFDYSGTQAGTLTADGKEVASDGETITAADADVNVILSVNAGTLTVSNAELVKSGDDYNDDNCNFYGLNAISLTSGENSFTYLSDSSLSAVSAGSNAVFSTDAGTAYVNNISIETSANSSRGLDATYGGTIIADNVNIHTQGAHCAATATDRGGGFVSVTNSSFNTEGIGSPLVYSTGDIEVNNVTGTAAGSQIAGMEGLNTILILNSELESTKTGPSASDPVANGVIIYQSTSGDAEASTGERATFQVINSTLTSAIESGSMFYVTNTQADILLSGTQLNFDSSAARLLLVSGNSSNNWGKSGNNGAIASFTALGETLEGDIEVDSISSLSLYLLQGTTYEGAVILTENEDAENSEANIDVTLDETSVWVLTADSQITTLTLAEGAQILDSKGKTVSIISNSEEVINGESDIILTVSGSYNESVSLTDLNTVTDEFIDRSGFDDYYGTETSDWVE